MMSPEVNYQYYNPEIRYFPAVNSDGTSKGEMNATATGSWTAVPTDNVTTAGTDTFRVNILEMNGSGSSQTTSNLVTGFPDRAWCTSQGADENNAANYPSVCRLNSEYTYPNLNYGFGRDSGTTGSIKYVNGAPYYYRLLPTEYCLDSTLKDTPTTPNCIVATAPTGPYTVPGTLRFCADTGLTNCQGKLTGSFTRPKYTGFVVGAGGPGTAAPATATITVTNPQGDSFGGVIQSINVNGVNVITGTITTGTPIVPNAAALQIRDAINANSATSGYSATVNNNVVTIIADSTPAAPYACVAAAPQLCTVTNGYAVSVGSVGMPIAPASVTFDVEDADQGTPGDRVTSIRLGLVEVLGATVYCNGAFGCTSGNQNTRNNQMGNAIADQINANVGGHGYIATTASNGSQITITAPAGTGGELNGLPLVVTEVGLTNSGHTGRQLAGGSSNGDVETVTVNFSGGVDDNEGRGQVGKFVRVNIVPGATFTKYAKRTDCAAASCTYDEEMTNFANWYAYYRSRMQMAKTAIGRAFAGIDDSYRVGFITINPGGPVVSGRFLAAADFDSTQKASWYTRLYDQEDHGSTPLRQALSRVGRYYGDVTTGINSGMPGTPIQVSCQPNYAILTTDGYWNGSDPPALTGNIGNHDNQDVGNGKSPPWSSRANATYDGGAATNATKTLADVAMYYYQTDLSPLADNSPLTQEDNAPHQHMVTFTVGLGLAGLLNFDKNYKEQTTGDFADIKAGSNWPVPVSGTETTLDDLWHAAVNGRGTFFSARDPQQLSDGVAEALTAVQSRVGAGAAAATSNLQPVAGDNFAFTAQYQTVIWTGDLKARTIDLTTGIVATAELWSAANLLDQRSHTDRKIYTYDAADRAPPLDNGNGLKAFCWPGTPALYTGCAGEPGLSVADMGFFDPSLLAQWAGWAADLPAPTRQDPGGASAQKLVDFLRGDTANESSGGTTQTDLFRNRAGLLGDIVNAQPAYVKSSPFTYDDGLNPGYAAFKAGLPATRKGTVFIAANDGMLHALETDPDGNPYYQTAGISTAVPSDDVFTGTLNTSPTSGEGSERWAYVPSIVMPEMKFLAETTALFVHRYNVDGSPTVGDAYDGSAWHTVLVAGLNAGGRGYYALDITDPDNPKALWELKGGTGTTCLTTAQANSGSFSGDCNIGLSFGNPVLSKRPSDGKWVVFVTSGHNNLNPGDGTGYFYVIDAFTGKILQRIGTGVGCDGVSTSGPCVAGTADPSGLNRLNAWVDDASRDNLTLRLYAGDLKGNLWRVQLDGSKPSPNVAFKLATLTDPGGVPQPITTKPELGEISGKAVVFVGTGKLLGPSDSTTTQTQTMYAIWDDYLDSLLASPQASIVGPRLSPGFVAQTLTNVTSATRTASANPVDWANPATFGWYVDLPESGERINVDPILQLGTLVIPTNVPSSDACVAGGFGWLNFLDFRTGSFVPGATLDTASTKISASLVVGVNVIKLPSGAIKTIVTTADNQQLTQETPISPPAISGKRVSWRELVVQ